jgi:hypothetical protein
VHDAPEHGENHQPAKRCHPEADHPCHDLLPPPLWKYFSAHKAHEIAEMAAELLEQLGVIKVER